MLTKPSENKKSYLGQICKQVTRISSGTDYAVLPGIANILNTCIQLIY